MKKLIAALVLLPSILQALEPVQVVSFTSVSSEQDYGLFLVAGPSDCPATRFMILGDGLQAISDALAPGESAILPLGQGFAVGPHTVELTAVGCDAPVESLRLVIMNRTSPGHGRAQSLSGVEAVVSAGN
jgi:hypothetical protein